MKLVVVDDETVDEASVSRLVDATGNVDYPGRAPLARTVRQKPHDVVNLMGGQKFDRVASLWLRLPAAWWRQLVGERGCSGSSSARVEDPEGDDESVVGGEED